MVKHTLLCVAVFVPCLLFLLTCSTNFWFSSLLLTIPILIIPTTVFLFKPTKKKVTVSENPSRDEQVSSRPISFPEERIEDESQVSQESDGDGNMLEYQVDSLDFPSDSESSDELLTSEGIELNWVGSNNVGQFLAISEEEDDGDDDDGLIEINLPGNDLIEGYKQDLEDFLPESVFQQQGLMELLAELNKVTEEDNLIEIDLSMGSIKCPMFEVEA
ncbi:hypothetical protein HS088_TW21G00610 [Tripterygium wilfordii]|uniref:Uncharacterized protein n=1 Tax=Tripterygium wilfordii TaxID=458696 RepID=A0A7J7C2X8_TRIWF|nr:uncharacterized protein LOC119989656 [Tripterygium wilfordii]KAF5728463.1 hypothetical protein HS088_TW21G00610 [Tripterygium wilfordii]